MDTKSPSSIYSKNMVNKIFTIISKNFPQKSEKELLLSEKIEPIFLNNKHLIKKTKSEKIQISFIEQINPENYSLTIKNLIFITNSEKGQFLKMVNYINKFCEIHAQKNLKILLLISPRKNFLTKILLEKNFSSISKKYIFQISDLNLDFFALEEDLLTLDYKSGFSEILTKKNFFFLNLASESLHKFQILFGEFKYFLGKGENSKKVIDLVKNLKKDFKRDLNFETTFFESCFIFDRSEDLFTPLLFQFTYNGLLDEIFGIFLNCLFVEKNILDKNSESEKKLFYDLKKNEDLVFKKDRDLHFIHFVKNLKSSIKQLKNLRENPDFSNLEKTLEIAEKIKNKPFIEFHLSLTSKIDKFLKNPINREKIRLLQSILIKNNDSKILIEDLVNLIEIEAPIKIVINVLILFNFVLKGFAEDEYTQIFELLINCYGTEILPILLKLKKNGFFVIKNEKSENFDFIKKNDFDKFSKIFDFIKTDVDIYSQKDITNSYTGYKPISICYLEKLLKNENVENLGFYKEKDFDFQQFSKSRNILIFFLGGVTYGEIACVRKLGEVFNKNFVVCTTDVVRTESFLDVFFEEN